MLVCSIAFYANSVSASSTSLDTSVTIDRIQVVNQQINLLKNRLTQGERELKELQEKASAPPKIIRRTIVKNKFKLPKFNLNWIKNIDLNKNIQQLHVPGILRIKQ